MKTFHNYFEILQKRQSKQEAQISNSSNNLEKITPQNHASKKPSNNYLSKLKPAMVFTVMLASLTSTIGHRFYSQPQLAVDTISPVTLLAPQDGSFEDHKTTEKQRKDARNAVIPVLKKDVLSTKESTEKLKTFLKDVEQLRSKISTISLVNTQIITLAIQQQIFSLKETQWQQIIQAVDSDYSGNFSSPVMQQIRAQLKTYRQRVSINDFATLTSKLNQSRQNYAELFAQFPTEITLDEQQKHYLLQIEPKFWQQDKAKIFKTSEIILAQGIPQGFPPTLINSAIQMHLQGNISSETVTVAINILSQTLEPNLIEDQQETKRRAEQAALEVKSVIVSIKQGEVIVNAKEKITQEDFVLLDAFGLSRREINGFGLALSAVLVSGSIIIFKIVAFKTHRKLRCRDHLLLCLLSISAPLLNLFQIPYTSLPAIGLLVSSFYGPTIAVTHVLLLTGLVAFGCEATGWEYILAGAISGLLGAALAGKLRCREELALLGAVMGLTQGGVYLIVNLLISGAAEAIWFVVLPEAAFYGMSGLAWIVVALGLSPYLESLFDLITPIRLAELSNPNRPLLKRLATQAPGTFQHTMFVASLAEAAARELGCNVELVRAGTLYHDIGKLHDPLGFIENQMGCQNKHDHIKNPWISAQIIKKHVSEGLILARKYGLPKAIRDFIPQHQGTLLISYFYFQAKHLAEQESKEISELDFRYDGPIPQSREAGIMMLADGCEAALRSLKDRDVTPDQALSMVSKILKARWQDKQLADSGIKYEELPIIAKIFVQVWQQYNHQRIAYPQAVFEPRTPKNCPN